MHPQADGPAPNGSPFQPESSRSNPLNGPYDGRAGMGGPLKGKEKQQRTGQQTGSLQLLDLPMDVLKDIIKEVTHTNDLTSLALTHSALHNIAVPQIYSRFDIVWPDAHSSSEPRSGVDALTFGLATLVMREDLFDYTPAQNGQSGRNSCVEYSCNHCGMTNHVNENTTNTTKQVRRPRRGNLFSQYTRKFSLGNGPPEWVQEYLITKEAGKMLGTLVALTIARMPNLETFVWDMPTGVLREVWHALANTSGVRRSRLEKVWVRFHDNKDVLAVTAPTMVSIATAPISNPNGLPAASDPYPSHTTGMAPMTDLEFSYKNTECPSLSILPPLKSLTVLEVDEPAYLAEMSVLIQRSTKSLRELRVGIATSYNASLSTSTQRHPLDPRLEYIAHGGFLGLIMSKIFDCRPALRPEVRENTSSLMTETASVVDQGVPKTVVLPLSALTIEEEPPLAGPASIRLPDSPDEAGYTETTSGLDIAGTYLTRQGPSGLIGSHTASSPNSVPNAPNSEATHESTEQLFSGERHNLGTSIANHKARTMMLEVPRRDRLSLEVLELERVPMAVPVLMNSIDWSILTSLTLLQCSGHEELWKALKRKFSPKSSSGSFSISSPQTSSGQGLLRRRTSSKFDSGLPSDYRLSLKKLHTDFVSPGLVAFLKEALAPNSLESLILQDRGKSAPSVTVDSIYRGPVRYHRSSLKRLSIDSSEKAPDSRSRSNKWKKWMLNREILTFITSGKMSSLRELGMAVDYKDWHLFLQRLPNIPHLRSLYVPHIANNSYGHHLDAKELASQVVNIVIALRPEIELCYMGILTKCFEILENRNHDDSRFSSHDSRTNPAHAGPGGVGDSDNDSDASDDDHDDDDDDDSDNTPSAPAVTQNNEEDSDSEDSNAQGSYSDDEGNEEGNGKCAPKFRLREILFYDDKISIFKARHGRL